MIILMDLIGYSFISPVVQNIFYMFYILTSFYILYGIKKGNQVRISHWALIILSLILFIIILRNSIIGFPLLFIFPILASKKSPMILKLISWIAYIAVCLFFCLCVFIRHGFARTYVLSNEISPDKRYNAAVIVQDQGALGGAIEVRAERLYGGIVKKSRVIYTDRLSEPKIQWVNDHTIKINDLEIDLNERNILGKKTINL